jgi:hypothetical protein
MRDVGYGQTPNRTYKCSLGLTAGLPHEHSICSAQRQKYGLLLCTTALLATVLCRAGGMMSTTKLQQYLGSQMF